MITIADLNNLRTSPQVAYAGYHELREAARRRNGGFADPREIPAMEALMRDRGRDWCSAVLGYPVAGGLSSISSLDAGILMVAAERGLDPPLPPWLVQWKTESAETQRRRDEAREQAWQRDRDRWAAALAASGVAAGQLEVRENTRSTSQVRGGARQALRHVVPLVAVRSDRRRHPAGQELCAVRRARVLGEPTGEPATCVSCIAYTAKIRPADELAGQTRSRAGSRR